MMRITGGRFSGRRLEHPKGPPIRTTQDRIRQNLFNLLADRVEGARVLDLFAGSGALGIEAFSRGAKEVTCVDRSGFAIRAIQENLKTLEIGTGYQNRKSVPGTKIRDRYPVPGSHPNPVTVIRSDAIQLLRRLHQRKAPPFDLVLLDPPYGRVWARKTLNALGRYAILSASGVVVVEHAKQDPLPSQIDEEASRLVSQRQERYGDTALTIYQRQ